jgi:hypothetical protein
LLVCVLLKSEVEECSPAPPCRQYHEPPHVACYVGCRPPRSARLGRDDKATVGWRVGTLFLVLYVAMLLRKEVAKERQPSRGVKVPAFEALQVTRLDPAERQPPTVRQQVPKQELLSAGDIVGILLFSASTIVSFHHFSARNDSGRQGAKGANTRRIPLPVGLCGGAMLGGSLRSPLHRWIVQGWIATGREGSWLQDGNAHAATCSSASLQQAVCSFATSVCCWSRRPAMTCCLKGV